MKNQKGITLIALVITIIVLLILAGVSIAMLSGENGLLNRSNQAKKETVQAEAVERINLALNAIKVEAYAERVSNNNWKAVTPAVVDDEETTDVDETAPAALKAGVTTVITNDGFTLNATEGYGYTFSEDTITLSYANESLGITTISGTFTVDDNSITAAVVPAE